MADLPGSEIVKMTVDANLVRAVVEKQVCAAVASEFQKFPTLLEKVVQIALNHKVDNEGKVNSYSSYNTVDYIEWLCQDSIRKTAEVAVRQWVEERKPEVTAAIKKHLAAKKTEFVKRYVDACDKSISPNFFVRVELEIPK